MKNLKKLFCSTFLLFLFSILVAESLPSGYENIQLGMSVDSAKEELKKNLDFGYRGDRDVSLLPGENRTLIETNAAKVPSSYFTRCFFQFYKEKLCVITINLNQQKMDYFSVFTALNKKYGEPVEFSPNRCLWQDSSVQLALEKPLTLKYTDLAVRKELEDKSFVEDSTEEKLASEFLDSL